MKKKEKNKKVIDVEPDVEDSPIIEEEPGGGVFNPEDVKGSVINRKAFEAQRLKGKI